MDNPQILPLPPTRDALHAQPDQLRREIDAISEQIQAIVLSSFRAHVSSFRCEADVKNVLGSGSEHAAALDKEAEEAGELAAQLEAPLASLQGEHNRLRKTLGQQSTILEVLEAPALMESCVRAGLNEEALDVADYATSLYFTHKLWLPASASPASSSSSSSHSTAVISSVVREIRQHAEDLRTGLLRTLSGKVALPQALAVLGHLRRLYSQQALAKRRVKNLATAYQLQQQQQQQQGASSSAAGGSSSLLSASDFSLTEEEEEGITFRLLTEFLHCRGEVWHGTTELGMLSKHSPYNYLLRVIEAQRSQWADIASQFNAVATSLLRSLATSAAQRLAAMQASAAEDSLTLTLGSSNSNSKGRDSSSSFVPSSIPSSSPTAAAATATATAELLFSQRQQRARAMLFDWLNRRVSWFLETLSVYLPRMMLSEEEGAALHSSSSSSSSVSISSSSTSGGGGGGSASAIGKLVTVATQSFYAARRAGRLGLDYSPLLAPVFSRQIEGLLVGKVVAAMAAFETEVNAWEWAYKPSTNTNTTPNATGTSGSGGGSESDVSTLSLPSSSLLPHPPLAALANHLFTTFNNTRMFFPASGAAYPLLGELLALVVRGCSAVLETVAMGGSTAFFTTASAGGAAAAATGGAVLQYNENSPVAILANKQGRKLAPLPSFGNTSGASTAAAARSSGAAVAPLQAARGNEEHLQAIRRLEALCISFTDGFCGALNEYLAIAFNAGGNLPVSSTLLQVLAERNAAAAAGQQQEPLGAGFALNRLQKLAAASASSSTEAPGAGIAGAAGSTSILDLSPVSVYGAFDEARALAGKTMATVVREHTRTWS